MSAALRTTWYDWDGLLLESDRLRVVVVPELGAKIVSLYDKAHAHEWLVPPMRPLKRTAYGDDFVSQDMSGWDEMMPTINRCHWAGADLPDHGEVWSIPWTVEEKGPGLATSVLGTAFPYRFTRSVSFVSAGCLELGYTLMNTGSQKLEYLWAAHPQFAADAHTKIVFPAGTQRVVNVVEGDPLWGAAGSILAWPRAQAPNGKIWALDRIGPASQGTCRKYYLLPEEPATWAALDQEDLGCRLRMDWDSSEVSYLGVWVDEGACNALPVAALEPSNGFYDGLDTAAAQNRLAVLPPGEQSAWTLRLSFTDR